jgi:large subunit ribosomal protein L30
MLIAIRISGQIEIPKKIQEALFRLRIRKKYTATLLQPTVENQKLLKKLRNYIAYGDIDKETLKLLIEKRAKPLPGKKLDVSKTLSDLEKKKITELDIKPFFGLHPAKGGIDSKLHFGTSKKAVLGDNKKSINDLVRRML